MCANINETLASFNLSYNDVTGMCTFFKENKFVIK